jgi:hypothetical protein
MKSIISAIGVVAILVVGASMAVAGGSASDDATPTASAASETVFVCRATDNPFHPECTPPLPSRFHRACKGPIAVVAFGGPGDGGSVTCDGVGRGCTIPAGGATCTNTATGPAHKSRLLRCDRFGTPDLVVCLLTDP